MNEYLTGTGTELKFRGVRDGVQTVRGSTVGWGNNVLDAFGDFVLKQTNKYSLVNYAYKCHSVIKVFYVSILFILLRKFSNPLGRLES